LIGDQKSSRFMGDLNSLNIQGVNFSKDEMMNFFTNKLFIKMIYDEIYIGMRGRINIPKEQYMRLMMDSGFISREVIQSKLIM